MKDTGESEKCGSMTVFTPVLHGCTSKRPACGNRKPCAVDYAFHETNLSLGPGYPITSLPNNFAFFNVQQGKGLQRLVYG